MQQCTARTVPRTVVVPVVFCTCISGAWRSGVLAFGEVGGCFALFLPTEHAVWGLTFAVPIDMVEKTPADPVVSENDEEMLVHQGKCFVVYKHVHI